ncbi:hypothetical protein HZU73_07704 [Apis mellifera caucasica]|nr:hypothetical protein HZU73_07704 [Apis mellifera caucasica]
MGKRIDKDGRKRIDKGMEKEELIKKGRGLITNGRRGIDKRWKKKLINEWKRGIDKRMEEEELIKKGGRGMIKRREKGIDKGREEEIDKGMEERGIDKGGRKRN